MLKTNISLIFPHHTTYPYNSTIFIVDYTEQTKRLPRNQRRSVEIFAPNPPRDNLSFKVENAPNLEIESIIFDNSSFTYTNGNSKSQCEASTFPRNSDNSSWILFTELKYSSIEAHNEMNLEKARKQLFKTRYHYIQAGVFDPQENTSYLIASLPKQREPFANFTLTPSYLSNLKTKHNVILRFQNSVRIINKYLVLV